MPWYYYSGNVSRPMPVKKGLSVSVKPHSKVELLEPNLREVQALIGKGLLRRSSPPKKKFKSIVDAPIVEKGDIEAVTPKSALAARIAEKGVTGNKSQAPRMRKGSPEMTDGELVASAGRQPESVAVEPAVNSESDVGQSGESLVSDGPVEVLSSVDGSSDGNDEGENSASSKKKKSRGKK